MATPASAMRCTGQPVIGSPANATLPCISGSTPASARRKVVLPAPLAPISASRVPVPTW
jgi:hypothetical protein